MHWDGATRSSVEVTVMVMVGECTSLHMPDAQSLPAMVRLHESLFGKGKIGSIATDKGYYSYDNERQLEQMVIQEI